MLIFLCYMVKPITSGRFMHQGGKQSQINNLYIIVLCCSYAIMYLLKLLFSKLLNH